MAASTALVSDTQVTPDRGVAGLEAAAGRSFSACGEARVEYSTAGSSSEGMGSRPLEIDRQRFRRAHGLMGSPRITSESDDDFDGAVLEGIPATARPSIEEDVANALGGRPPGPEADLRQVDVLLVDDLRAKIGRERGPNANLTRRMLLMLESVPSAASESTVTRGAR